LSGAAALVFVWAATLPCWSQQHRMLCNHGNNGFRADSPTGVAVVIGPSRSGSFAGHACTAELVRSKQVLEVADQAAQIDLDLFAVDVGLDGPVAAFQLKQSPESCCLNYLIYSLAGPPRLLRTLHGGFFNAADTNLDGRVEIWAEDGEAVEGLDSLPASAFDFLPTYVLRFEGNRLVDTTKSFAPHFDEVIRGLRAKLTPEQLADFKRSDGKLTFSIAEVERLHNLRATKIAILEIVWTYLYSGREDEAWRTLNEMWPTTDVDRIQAAITDRRRRGLLTQLDGAVTQPISRKHRPIYMQSEVTPALAMDPSFPEVGSSTAESQVFDMVIDSAGKVHVVIPESNMDPYTLAFVRSWKFVPGMRGGHSVASRLHLAVSLKR
jgi:hypothetical protein